MTLFRLCGCGRKVIGTNVCAECRRMDNYRRHRKQRRQGKDGVAWKRTRALVLQRDGYRCTYTTAGERCTATEDLTVHLPGGGYHHPDPTLYRTLCRSHHGSVDARRASIGKRWR